MSSHPQRVVLGDSRGDGRALRVTWHEDAGVVVLSVWRSNVCAASVRLEPDDAARLIAALASGLGRTPERAPGTATA